MLDAVAAATEVVTSLLAGGADDPLLPWCRRHLAGRAHEAFAALEARPDSEARQSILREELVNLLRQDPALLANLSELLPAPAPGVDTATQPIAGGGAIGELTRHSDDNA